MSSLKGIGQHLFREHYYDTGHYEWHVAQNLFTDALMQHYGVATNFLDCTQNAEVAFWFATHQYNARPHLFGSEPAPVAIQVCSYSLSKENIGVLFAFGLPRKLALEMLGIGHIVNLTHQYPGLIRPRAQSAWMLYQGPDVKVDINQYILARVHVVPPTNGEAKYTTKDLFPDTADDEIYDYLLSMPLLQHPIDNLPLAIPPSVAEYFIGEVNERPPVFPFSLVTYGLRERYDEQGWASDTVFIPFISVPCFEHTLMHLSKGNTYSAKNLFLCESEESLHWRSWSFDLKRSDGQFHGKYGDCVKIVVTPMAWETAKEIGPIAYSEDLAWLDLESNDLLFVEVLHSAPNNKHQYPRKTNGIWLHREDALIIEHTATFTEGAVTLCTGHLYRLRADSSLAMLDEGASCRCPDTERHRKRVEILLRFQPMLTTDNLGYLSLAKHPFTKGCYVIYGIEPSREDVTWRLPSHS